MSSLENTAISRPQAAHHIPGYRLEGLVGSGGMGEVHKATQLSLNRTVAIKLLSPQLAQDESFVARFQKEAAALATLHHPHIVSILDRGRTDSTYYLVMEFVDGPSLREQMRSPLLDASHALRMMWEICRAIHYAHGRGVIHRDLKPENILFDAQAGGLAKVTDFGLASFLDDVSARYALTGTHMAMGTLSYMAPEQRVDAKNVDERADIYALGVILYELLVGEVPMGNFEPPSSRKPEVDPRLDAIVARCLKPSPADRYASVAELLTELEPLIPGLSTVKPVKLSRLQRLGLAVRRVVRTCLQVVATLVVLAAVGVLSMAWLRGAERPVRRTTGALLTDPDVTPTTMQRMKGQLDTRGDVRKVSTDDGADSLPFVVSGRSVRTEDKALVFEPVEGSSRVGLLRVDVVDLEGDVARFTARVSAEGPVTTPETRARALVYGPPPDPEAALLLLGSPGRYVALVHNGMGAPLKLEWALGERRGTMLGRDAPLGPVDLELTVDTEGVLRASLLQQTGRRDIAEPLHLGPGWQKLFGGVPMPAFGCIEGACRAEGFTYSIRRVAPPAPVATPQDEGSRRATTKTASPSRGKRSR